MTNWRDTQPEGYDIPKGKGESKDWDNLESWFVFHSSKHNKPVWEPAKGGGAQMRFIAPSNPKQHDHTQHPNSGGSGGMNDHVLASVAFWTQKDWSQE